MNNLLIVDVDGAARDQLAGVLESAGHRVLATADPVDACNLAQSGQLEVALIGLQLANGDGIELARRLQADPVSAQIVLVHVAYRRVDSETQVASLEAGADGCLTLPMPPRELLARIGSLLRRRQAADALRHRATRQQSLNDVSESCESARKLLERQPRYRSLFEHHPDSVFLLDTDGRVIDGNAAFLALTGWSGEEALPGHFAPTVAPEMLASTQSWFARALGGEPVRYETVALNRQGQRIPVEVTNLPMIVDGSIAGVFGIARDLSRRHAAEAALERSRALLEIAARTTRELAERLESAFGSIDAACITLDGEWRFTYLNGRAEDLLQRERSSLYGKIVWEEIPAWIGSEIGLRCRQAAQERCTVSFEARWASSPSWLGITAYPAAGGLAIFMRDVTTQRLDAQRMRLLEACVARSNDIVLICEADSLDEPGPRTVYVNPAFQRITGYSPTEIIGRSPRLLQGPRTDRSALRRIRDALISGQPVREELINYTKEGHPIWLEVDVAPVADDTGRFTHWIAIQRDIGGRKAAEHAAEESLVRFRLLAEASLDAIGEWNLVTGELWWSDGYQRLFGRPPEKTDPPIDGWSRHIHPDDVARVMTTMQAFGEGSEDQSAIEYRYEHADGRWLDVLVRVRMIRDAGGRPVRMVGGMSDLSTIRGAQRRVESQLDRMELLQRITHAIGERDDLDRIYRIVCDRLAEQMPAALVAFGEPATMVCSLQIRHRATAAAAGTAQSERLQAVELGDPAACVERALRGEFVYQTDTREAEQSLLGRLADAGLYSLVLAPLEFESNVFGVLLLARESADAFGSADCEFLRQLSGHVSLAAQQAQLHRALQSAYDRLRHTQQAVLQQERLRALGEMASGIAHDINNAVSPAALYVEAMLEGEPGLSARGRERLAVISRAIEDVAHTVARMREFYRPRDETVSRQPVDIGLLVDQVIELTRARWRDMPQRRGIAIEVVRDFAPLLPTVRAVDTELRDALTNLIFNAVDAMPTGGRLTIRTLLQPSAVDGGRITVEVEDDGVGMDEATLKQCMEPFFTTKGERGTGLGLAMVYGTMQRHGGEVEVVSSPGSGTRARLHFPVKADTLVAAPPQPVLGAVTRTLHVLVVDDDPLILRSLSDMLRDDGHQVETADGGAAAVTRLRAIPPAPAFDVILTDLGMPHVDGIQVARIAKTISPAPVVMLTGWGQRMNDDGEHPSCVDRVLAKPPRLAELRRVLAELCVVEPRSSRDRG